MASSPPSPDTSVVADRSRPPARAQVQTRKNLSPLQGLLDCVAYIPGAHAPGYEYAAPSALDWICLLLSPGVNPRVENQHNRDSREGATDSLHPGIDNLRHATSREAATDP